VILAGRPVGPVLELGGFAWRRATAADAPVLESLAARGANRALFALPGSTETFAARIGRPGFRLAMLCMSGSRPFGVAATANRNTRSENAQLLCFFAQPVRAVLPLAAYVRHVFWLTPMHRLYVQLPLVAGAAAYAKLLTAAGFQQEGVLRDYAVIGEKMFDVAGFGLLRPEFEDWCRKNESRLKL
jgi:hypothetical protein